MRYSVIVGNIGTIYDGDSLIEANRVYGEYKRQSQSFVGRAGAETVSFLCDGELRYEFRPKHKLPKIGELRALLVYLKKTIGDDFRSEGSDDDDSPSMDVTIGWRESGEWSYQTGDNSFTGGAYGYPHWAVITIDRRSNSTELAREIVSQLAELSRCE